MKFTKLLAVLLAMAMLAVACGSDDGGESETATDDAPAADTSADEPEADEPADDAAPAPAPGFASGIDIDSILAVDLNDCEAEPTGEPIRVGMAMDFGDVSGFADIPGSEAVKHLGELINCAGGIDGAKVEVQVQDIQGDPEVTARATQDLLDFGAHFLIGPPFADFGQPVLQVTEGKVPAFFAASTEPSLYDAGANSFLVTFDDTAQATAAAEWALAEGFTEAITFSSPGPYFGYNPEIFTEVFEAGGGTVLTDQTYVPVDDVDFSAQVNEVAAVADGDEVLYSAMLAFQLTALRGQLEGQGLNDIQYIATDAWEATGGLFDEKGDGVVHTTHAFIEPGGRIEALLASYEAANGTPLESGTFAGLYADSLFLGIQGILDCGCTDPEAIGAAVAEISGFEGFTGAMSFAGTNGLPDKPVSIHRTVGGADELVANW